MSALDWRAITSLWPNQFQALERLETFLENPPDGGALVQMPTGTGKTGIIAIISRLRADIGRAVIVASPSDALAVQLCEDIRSIVWQRLGLGAPWSQLMVPRLLRSNASRVRRSLAEAKQTPCVLVGTLQALSDIQTNDVALYEELKNSVSLVLVDEGHREPAPRWSDAVESMSVPIVLFSATPYRNDLRVFRVSPEHIIYDSFQWAVDERLIRDVTFEDLDSESDAGGFAVAAAHRFQEMVDAGRALNDAKAILRFSNVHSLNAAINALETDPVARALGFVGVHERFKSAQRHRLKTADDLRGFNERLFLHQFKLCEGLDEPRCSVLFLHRDFSNERQLVQQIGRCLRRRSPREGHEPDAIVVTRAGSTSQRSWHMYREFDRSCQQMNGAPMFDESAYGRKIRDLGVPAEYSGRKFRIAAPIALLPGADDAESEKAAEDVIADVIVPRRCVVYTVDGEAETRELFNTALAELEKRGREILATGQPLDEYDLHVAVSHVIDTSDYFSRFAFTENHYALTVLLRLGNRVFLFDSDRYRLAASVAHSSELRRLFPDGDSTRISMAATRSTDLSPRAIRSKSIETSSLVDIPIALDDFFNVLSRVRGSTGTGADRSGRYLGLLTAQVSDTRNARVDLEEYADWCESLEARLNDDASTPAEVFDRFANPVEAPDEPIPTSILLDVSRFPTTFSHVDDDQDELSIVDSCATMVNNEAPNSDAYPWSFVSTIEKADGSVEDFNSLLTYDPQSERFIIASALLCQYISRDDNRSALDALNADQAFRITTNDSMTAYAFGEFYRIDRVRRTMTPLVGGLLRSVPAFAALETEKGENAAAWESTSVFGYVVNHLDEMLFRQLAPGNWDGLVCDDLGSNEIADFVAYRLAPPAVAFIHCNRAHGNHQISASALHDVVAQAIKNLNPLAPGAGEIDPNKSGLWNRNWAYRQRRIPRRCLGTGTGAERRQQINQLLRSPNTQRHVCIAIAGAISRDIFLAALGQAQPPSEAIQAFLQLASFYTHAESLGIIPTVLCN